MNTIPRLVIAAPHSRAGKTTITTGIIAALAHDHVVAPFKCGPDYIDPGYHTLAAERKSRNLDTWMIPPEQVTSGFVRAAHNADIAVIEGVMGLYDGYDALTERGSTAEIAKLLSAPVILVIDASAAARSVGAVALGFREFDPEVRIAGVICNRVGSSKHTEWVTQAVESVGIPVLGCLPRQDTLTMPERHLGLVTTESNTVDAMGVVQRAEAAVREHIDLGKLLQIARDTPAISTKPTVSTHSTDKRARIAVAQDAAFSFYYQDNLDLLEEAGAEIVPFSPLADKSLPPDINALYIGGGYPELYVAQLAENNTLLKEMQERIAQGLPTYAECGGLMLLTEAFMNKNETKYSLIGAIPGTTRMVDRLTMGYREVTATHDTLLLLAGETVRGHEFHYSTWENPANNTAYTITPRGKDAAKSDGFARGNLLASYVHIHFAAMPALAERFVNAAHSFSLLTDKSRADNTE